VWWHPDRVSLYDVLCMEGSVREGDLDAADTRPVLQSALAHATEVLASGMTPTARDQRGGSSCAAPPWVELPTGACLCTLPRGAPQRTAVCVVHAYLRMRRGRLTALFPRRGLLAGSRAPGLDLTGLAFSPDPGCTAPAEGAAADVHPAASPSTGSRVRLLEPLDLRAGAWVTHAPARITTYACCAVGQLQTVFSVAHCSNP
jgi:hypothetical protein